MYKLSAARCLGSVFLALLLFGFAPLARAIFAVDATLVKDINTVAETQSFCFGGDEFLPIGSVVYFCARDTVEGDGLWRSDGTPTGTFRIKGSLTPQYLTNVNGTLFFYDHDFDSYRDTLWKSDGTTYGTTLVKQFYHSPVSIPRQSRGL